MMKAIIGILALLVLAIGSPSDSRLMISTLPLRAAQLYIAVGLLRLGLSTHGGRAVKQSAHPALPIRSQYR